MPYTTADHTSKRSRRTPTLLFAAALAFSPLLATACADDDTGVNVSETTASHRIETTGAAGSGNTPQTSDPTAIPSTTVAARTDLVTDPVKVTRDLTATEGESATLQPDGVDPPEDLFTTPRYRLSMAANTTRNGALGSGCSPPGGSAMPDGIWYGYVNRLDAGVIGFDLACLYVGDFSAQPTCEIEMDSCFVNESTHERTAPLSKSAVYHLPRRYAPDGMLVNDEADFEQFAVWLGHSPNTLPVWIKIDGGAVAEIEAQQQIAG